jgi:hypothetical protein
MAATDKFGQNLAILGITEAPHIVKYNYYWQ